MKIGAIGYNHQHLNNFLQDCPNGPGCTLLLLVREASVFRIGEQTYDVPPCSFVLLSADSPCSYHARGDVYADDWMYLVLTPEELAELRQRGIPADTPIPLGHMDELSQLIRFMTYEHISHEPDHEAVEQHYLQVFLIQLARQLRTASHASIGEKHAYLCNIRSLIYAAPQDIPCVQALAEGAGVSRSGLHHAYKKQFGVTIVEDIVASRMSRAKDLLLSTSLSVREVALRCGYSSEYAFMRRFKAAMGVTPSEFRRHL